MSMTDAQRDVSDKDYAPCPFCKQKHGMGLGANPPAKTCFVQCLCGAQGPRVFREQFRLENGDLDIASLDAATRRASNQSVKH